MSDIAIKVNNIGKRYSIGKKSNDLRESFRTIIKNIGTNSNKIDFWALQNINFEVRYGETIGIIGRNGAGKSTLLKILSRITKPTTGRLEISGAVSSLLEVGTGFHPELTGRENIFLNGTILGMKRVEIKKKFDEIIDFSGVEEFIDTPVKRYSSGMKVRLAFSVAAHLEPEILIIDEVLAVGDAEFQKKCLGKMGTVASEGRTVIFVSHNMGAVKSLCQKGYMLDHGKLVFSGDVSDVVEKYISSNFVYSGLLLKNQIDYQPNDLNIESVKLLNSKNEISNSYQPGEGWSIIIEIAAFKKFMHFIAGIGIMTMDDISVRTIYSEPQILVPGKYSIIFKIDDVFLASQGYKIIVGLSEREQAIVSVSDKLSFEIISNANKNKFFRTDPKFGVIINKANITFTKINA